MEETIFTFMNSRIPTLAVVIALCTLAVILLAIGFAKATAASHKVICAAFMGFALLIASQAMLQVIELIYYYQIAVGVKIGADAIKNLF